jgi:hypothetical protein
MYSSTPFLTSELEGGEGSASRPGRKRRDFKGVNSSVVNEVKEGYMWQTQTARMINYE